MTCTARAGRCASVGEGNPDDPVAVAHLGPQPIDAVGSRDVDDVR